MYFNVLTVKGRPGSASVCVPSCVIVILPDDDQYKHIVEDEWMHGV
jgi:hypothetical protein